MAEGFRYLGRDAGPYTALDTVPAPPGVTSVTYTSDEVTALCPVTGQPDWYTVAIHVAPDALLPESKSLKLFFHSLRDTGVMCEQLADRVAGYVGSYLEPHWLLVRVTQKPRGGITIDAHALWHPGKESSDA